MWTSVSPCPRLVGGGGHSVDGGEDLGDLALARGAFNAHGQGLTLVHFSARLERFEWDRGCGAPRVCVALVKGV